MAKIRIIACPPGEAPRAVREAWIGLELPLPAGRWGHRRVWLTTGVVSGPRTWWQRVIGILDGRIQAHAATWWRDNCPYLLDGKRRLVFPADVCQEAP